MKPGVHNWIVYLRGQTTRLCAGDAEAVLRYIGRNGYRIIGFQNESKVIVVEA